MVSALEHRAHRGFDHWLQLVGIENGLDHNRGERSDPGLVAGVPRDGTRRLSTSHCAGY